MLLLRDRKSLCTATHLYKIFHFCKTKYKRLEAREKEWLRKPDVKEVLKCVFEEL